MRKHKSIIKPSTGNSNQYLLLKQFIMHHLMIGLVVLFPVIVFAQEKPPKPITVTVSTLQHLEFGTVIQAGSYGTVYISKTGSRSVSGSVYQKSSTFTPALFIVTALPGTLITISSVVTSDLANGSFKLPLAIDKNIDTSTGSQFICTGETYVFVGGTLTVNSLNDNPAGPYYGEFTITFIQQ